MKAQHQSSKVTLAFAVVLLLVVIALRSPFHQAQAQPNCQTFPETAKTACGKFLVYWQTHGALPQQGYPISGEVQEVSDTDGKTYTVQYFERAVFELHPEFAGTENEVLLQLLGSFLFSRKYPQGAPSQTASADNPYKDPVTSHAIGGKFRTYYEKNGGLRQQGRPLSDEFTEKSDLDGKTYTVQYFERAVFELHPENQPPYDVLLSQLGTFRFRGKQGPGSQPTQGPTQVVPAPTPTTQITPPQPTAAPPPSVNAQFLGNVTDPANPFVAPVGLATDSQDNLYVLDGTSPEGTAYVLEFTKDGQPVHRWAAPSDGSSGTNNEIVGDLAVDSQGNVYVAQVSGTSIGKYDNNGNRLLSIGSQGSGDGQFARTLGVAADTQGNVYAIDDRRNTLQKFSSTGPFLLKTNEVHNAGYIATDSQGNVFEVDYGTLQVKKFDSNLHLVNQWSEGSRDENGIAVDREGNVYIANSEPSNNIVKFDPTGKPLGVFGTTGNGPGQFSGVRDVAVDSQGNIYVADRGNHSVQKFRLP